MTIKTLMEQWEDEYEDPSDRLWGAYGGQHYGPVNTPRYDQREHPKFKPEIDKDLQFD